MLRRPRQPDASPGSDAPDPLEQWSAGLAPQWRAPVAEAIGARRQFAQLLSTTPEGPTRDRLEHLAATIEQAVHRVAESAWRAQRAASLAAGLDSATATEELKAARRRLEQTRAAGVDTSAAEAHVAALDERHRAMHTALNLAEDAGARLGELNVRLQTATARATTVVLRASEGPGLDELDRELQDVVDGLTALDDALRQMR